MRLSNAIAAGLGLNAALQADTGATVTAGAAPANTAASPASTPDKPKRVRDPNAGTKPYETVESLKAASLVKNHRRYEVTAPDGKKSYFVARTPDLAIGAAAEKSGYKVINIDNPEGQPGRRAKSVEQMIEELPEDKRLALLTKYLGADAAKAAMGASATNGGAGNAAPTQVNKPGTTATAQPAKRATAGAAR